MEVAATTDSPLSTGAETLAVGVFAGERVAHDLPGGELGALLARGEGRTSLGHLALWHHDGRRILLCGLGPRDGFDGEAARTAAARVLARARELSTEALCWEIPHHVEDGIVAALVEGTVLSAYQYTRYRPPAEASRGDAPGQGRPAGPARLLVSAHHDVSAPAARAAVLAGAQNRARDLANTPANDLTPARLAAYAQSAADASDGRITCEILDGSAIRAAGMRLLDAVAAGSAEEPRVIILRYAGAVSAAPLGLIGKAVTFDSGGLWLKPGNSQRDMKYDMGGGAAVIEAVRALAELAAPIAVTAVVGAAENLPGPTATRPGDVVRALDGTAVQIDNTDAEGRLLLADCLTLAIRDGCTRLIDIATLTGGVVAALGSVHAGLMGTDDTLCAALEAAGRRTGELVWRLPLHPRYAEMVEGSVGQVVNLTSRREAMAITAAEFLHRFTREVPWAHVDIAGTGWDAHRPYLDSAGSGFGVRLLAEAATLVATEAAAAPLTP